MNTPPPHINLDRYKAGFKVIKVLAGLGCTFGFWQLFVENDASPIPLCAVGVSIVGYYLADWAEGILGIRPSIAQKERKPKIKLTFYDYALMVIAALVGYIVYTFLLSRGGDGMVFVMAGIPMIAVLVFVGLVIAIAGLVSDERKRATRDGAVGKERGHLVLIA